MRGRLRSGSDEGRSDKVISDGTLENAPASYRPEPLERAERGEEVFERARRHSRRVRLLKLALPAVAVLMIAAFAGYSFLSSSLERIADLGALSVEGSGVVMANPKLDGFTKDDLPYSLRADRARQPLDGSGAIELEGIVASVPIDKENRASITAKSGSFDREKNLLDIDSEITLNSTSGLQLRLQSANIDIGRNTLTTDKPVDIRLDGMHIAAEGMSAAEGGSKLIFEDRVRVEIDPARLKRTAERQND